VRAPDLAAFSFSLDPEGADSALARRVGAAASAHGARRVAVVGAERWALLAGLATGGLEVVAFDASREVLAVARDGLRTAGVADRVTLYAGDPRDAEVPDGADAALVTSGTWRVLLFGAAHESLLRSLRRALRGPALLLLDLDRVPPLPPGVATHLRDGPGRQRWTARHDGSSVRVVCAAPGVSDAPLDVAATQPEEAVAAVRAARFDVVVAEDAAGGPLHAASRRMWLVAQRAGVA
jgi:SAM-dependent methyltransferase